MSDLFNTLMGQVNPEALQDQTVAKASFEYKIPEKGTTVGRFIGYIETGKHPKFYQGKEKEHPAAYAKLVFELLGPKHVTEDDDGNKHGTLYYEDVTIKTDEKAAFRKLFMKMRGGREAIKHMAQMLGEGFIIKIVHNTVGEGDKKKTYANIKHDGEWLVMPPVKEDPLSGEAEIIKVPAYTAAPRLFLWQNPTKEQWDSIFIDGEYERKNADGTTETISKNFIQRRIMKARNFEDSPAHELLSGLGEIDLSDDDVIEQEPSKSEPDTSKSEPKDDLAPKTEKPASEAPVKSEEPKESDKPKDKEPPRTDADLDDLFADIGIKA